MPKLRHLVLPLAVLGALTTAASPSHTVVPGDTVSGIAKANGTTVDELVSANGLTNPDLIRAGERLELPAVGTAVVESAGASLGAAGPLPRVQVGTLIDRVANEQGWSSAFVKALAWQESGWNQDAVSSAGATGIMQVMPGTLRFINDRLVEDELDLHDPADNVTAGIVYLQHLWELTDGDVEDTLAGYYQGLRSVRDNGRYADTERYIDNILALRDRFR